MTSPLHILHVVGARPNFMKIAPLMRALAAYPQQVRQTLIHTGQHYDENMSKIFFEELELPRPDINLGVGSGSHTQQTAQVMLQFEQVLQAQKPDWVVVVGDVNSTLACSLVCSKLGTRVAHVEAGLRSWDRTMPEEINRLLTDQISDLLFTHSPEAEPNLLREGIPAEKIHFVGNVMIDTLIRLLPKARARWQNLRTRLNLPERFILATLHRPVNVDHPETLAEIIAALNDLSTDAPVIFPVHPRTRNRMATYGMQTAPDVHLLEPQGYLDFLSLQTQAALVLTDSGGVQEETTYLGIPCLTARPNTERPVTITVGTNRLLPSSRADLVAAARPILRGETRVSGRTPDLWDGHAAERIAQILLNTAPAV